MSSQLGGGAVANRKRLIVCADDFGLDPAVNEAVEEAHRDGILTSASLMVGASAVADAVARARRLPELRVGLHLVLVDGFAILPSTEIPDLVKADRKFSPNMAWAGFRYFFLPTVRQQLAKEIRAQFDAFRATGLTLDHVNAHKHMHIHPTVARLVVEIGREYGMKAVRVPLEPVETLRAALPEENRTAPFYGFWIRRLRRQLLAADLVVNEHLFGLAWSGNFDEQRWLRLLPHLPDGVSEAYLHPAATRTPALAAAMPRYCQEQELAALLSPAIRGLIAKLGIRLTGYSDIVVPISRITNRDRQ